MRVYQLIDELQKLPQHLIVRVETAHEIEDAVTVEEYSNDEDHYVDIVGKAA